MIKKNMSKNFFKIYFYIVLVSLFCMADFVFCEEIGQNENQSSQPSVQQINKENPTANENITAQHKNPTPTKEKKGTINTKLKAKENTQIKKNEKSENKKGENKKGENKKGENEKPENKKNENESVEAAQETAPQSELPAAEESSKNKGSPSAQKAVNAKPEESTGDHTYTAEDPNSSKITLPDLSDNNINENSSENTDKQIVSERLIKGVIAWVLIISGIALIGWVIFTNKNIPKEKAVKIKGKKNLYYKNSLRK